jgi:hypothetical protein
LEIIIQTLFQQLGFESLNDRSRLGLEAINVSQFNQILGTDGKQELCFQLQQAGLFITPQQIMSEITKQFTEEIGRWPRDLKTIFLSTQV